MYNIELLNKVLIGKSARRRLTSKTGVALACLMCLYFKYSRIWSSVFFVFYYVCLPFVNRRCVLCARHTILVYILIVCSTLYLFYFTKEVANNTTKWRPTWLRAYITDRACQASQPLSVFFLSITLIDKLKKRS